MTTKTFKVYRGYSNYITIKKPRYWATTDTKTLTTNSSYMYTLQQFSGLNATVNGSVVTVNSQDLWSGDYFNSKGSYILKTTGNNYLATDNNFYPGCLESGLSDTADIKTYSSFVKSDGSLMLSESDDDKTGWIWSNIISVPAHTVMDAKKANFNVNGTPTFNNYVASGFSASNYLTGNKTIPHSEFFQLDGVRFITRFKYTDTPQCAILMFHKQNNADASSVGTKNNTLFVWSGGDLVQSSTTLTSNTWYWLRVVWNGTNMLGYIYDGEIPPDDISQWTLFATTDDTNFNVFDYFTIGIGASSEYFRGEIDLLNTRIDTGVNNPEGATVWNTFWKALE